MAGTAKLVVVVLALCLLLAPPGLAWYRQVAGPNYYSVGRASGLLSGLRRSPYAPRSEPSMGTRHPGRAGASPESRPSLQSLTVCVTEVTPNLQSCEQLPDGRATFQCKADVFLSLRAADCSSV